MTISLCSQCAMDTGGNHEWNCPFYNRNSVITEIPKTFKKLREEILSAIEEMPWTIGKDPENNYKTNPMHAKWPRRMVIDKKKTLLIVKNILDYYET